MGDRIRLPGRTASETVGQMTATFVSYQEALERMLSSFTLEDVLPTLWWDQ